MLRMPHGAESAPANPEHWQVHHNSLSSPQQTATASPTSPNDKDQAASLQLTVLTCVLWSPRQCDSVVQCQAPHPQCAGKTGRQDHEGEAEDGADDLHWAVHHEDGQPDGGPGGGLLGGVGHHLHHLLGHLLGCAALLPGPDGHPQELQPCSKQM